jgi:anti-sigma B factor antagonist
MREPNNVGPTTSPLFCHGAAQPTAPAEVASSCNADCAGLRSLPPDRRSWEGHSPTALLRIRIEDTAMGIQKRIEVTSFSGSAGEVAMVRFLDRKIMDPTGINELGDELLALVEKEQRKNLLLNFLGVEFLSSAALNKLIVLDKRIKTQGGKLQLCNLRPEIFDIFAVTRLTQLFTIKKTEQEALATF